MRVELNVTQQLFELDGETPMVTSVCVCPACRQPVGEKEAMTVRLALSQALNGQREGERLTFKEQMERYELAKRVKANDIVELTVQEAGKLQGLLADSFRMIVTGQVGLLLEGSDD